MNGLTYTKVGDYYLPNLVLKEQPDTPIGKYGRMRLRYLKEHRKGLYTSLLLTEKLYPHLLEIDEAAPDVPENGMAVLQQQLILAKSIETWISSLKKNDSNSDLDTPCRVSE